MIYRYVAYGALIGVYALFAWVDKVPASGLIVVITGALQQLASAHQHEKTMQATLDAITPSPVLPTTIVKGE